MSSKRYAPLSIEPRTPRLAAIALVLGGAGALAGLWLAGLPGWCQPPLALGVLLLLRRDWRRHVSGRDARSIHALGRDSRGHWWVTTAAGRQGARLLGSSTVFPGLVVLSFATAGLGTIAIALTRDRVSPELWRRLLVSLRHEKPLQEKPS